MENNLSVFKFENQDVRVLEIDGQPWWIGKDVAVILGYAKPENAIATHVDSEDKTTTLIQGTGSNYKSKTGIINESGLYSLIIGSKLPSAKKFKHWVTSEVLPSIRKNGIYATSDTIDKMIDDPAFGIRLLTKLQDERNARMEAERQKALLEDQNKTLSIQNEAQQATIAIMKPKADYYDQILQCRNTMNATQIAKDYGMSVIAFNKLLNSLKIQFKSGNQWVLYQAYADKGYTRSETYVFDSGYHRCSNVQTKWTQEGRLFLYDTLKKRGILPVCERE